MALIAAVLGAACGRQAFRLTKPEFIKRTDATCLQFLESVDPLLSRIFGKASPDMRAAAAVQAGVVAGIKRMLDERDDLRPPAGDQQTIDAINGIERRTFERFIPAFQRAVTAGDADALGAAFQAADAGFGPGDDSQRAYGFKVCGAPAEGEGQQAVTPSAASVPGASPDVLVKGVAFRPGTVRIRVGQAVNWRFDDGTIEHNVTWLGIKSPTLAQGTWAYVFERRGDFEYICSLHPFMKGAVEVS